MVTYTKKKVNTGKFTSFYCEAGEGNKDTIIFLHGSGPGANSETNWKRALEVLGEKFHVIAPDMIGFGQTDLPENTNMTFWEWTTARVQQVLEIMDYNGIENAHLVGNSMGGFVSLNAVLYEPSRFNRLVLMGSAGGKTSGPTPEIIRMKNFYNDPTIQAFRNLITWFLYDESVLGEEIEEIVASRYENMMRPEIRELYPKLFGGPMDILIPPSALRRIKQPVLLIHGYEDQFVSRESSLSMLEHLPNAELILMKGCGHWAQIEKQERFLELTEQFFAVKESVHSND